MKRFLKILCFSFFLLFSSNNAFGEILKVGINAEVPPFIYVTSNGIIDQYDGFDVALIKAIAEDLGVELSLESMPVDSLIMGLKIGKIDVALSNLTITADRSRSIKFSTPYFTSNLTMLVQEDSSIQKASDMKGKRIIVVQGSTGETAVKKMGFPYVALKAFPEGFVELKNGKCDVFVVDETIARRYCTNLKGVKILQDNEAFGTKQAGIGVNKKKPELLKKINASLEKLQKSGTIDILLKKYIY